MIEIIRNFGEDLGSEAMVLIHIKDKDITQEYIDNELESLEDKNLFIDIRIEDSRILDIVIPGIVDRISIKNSKGYINIDENNYSPNIQSFVIEKSKIIFTTIGIVFREERKDPGRPINEKYIIVAEDEGKAIESFKAFNGLRSNSMSYKDIREKSLIMLSEGFTPRNKITINKDFESDIVVENVATESSYELIFPSYTSAPNLTIKDVGIYNIVSGMYFSPINVTLLRTRKPSDFISKNLSKSFI